MLYVSFDAMLYEHCRISWVYGSYECMLKKSLLYEDP